MADIVEVDAVERGIAAHQLGESRSQAFLYSRSPRVQVDPRSPHAIPLRIRTRQFGGGIVKNGPTSPVDQHHLVTEVLYDFRRAISSEGKNIDPRVDAQSAGMSLLDETSQGVGALSCDQRLIGSRTRQGGVVPGAAAPKDLHKEVGGPESRRTSDEGIDARRVFEDPFRTFREDPERPKPRLDGGLTAGRRDRGDTRRKPRVLGNCRQRERFARGLLCAARHQRGQRQCGEGTEPCSVLISRGRSAGAHVASNPSEGLGVGQRANF